ncbi:FAD-dependent monooxygenase [Nocardioides hungaricus]
MTRPPLLDPVPADEWPDQVDVLIVGGGPVGLASAILLAQRGVDVLLVERRSFDTRFPRAHLLNVRTMEIFHEMGVADDIYAQGPSNDWHRVVWYTSVTGPTPLHGLKLGEVPAWGGGADADRYAAASPRPFANLPQLRLDPLLYAHAAACCPGRVRAHAEVVALEQGPEGMSATIEERANGRRHDVRARYVIAADGGRVSSRLLGVELDGPTAIRDVTSFYLSTDLSMWTEPDALLAHFIQPRGRGRPVGTLQALGPVYYGRRSAEWLVAVARRHGGDADDEVALADARAMLGIADDHPLTVHAVSHWQYEAVVARRYRVGSAFLAGDAAHRHPPTGGLGLNGGVQDADNLCWKLALVLRGRAPESLLDTYELERRPTAAYYAAHALENAGRHAPIGAALGLADAATEEDGWAEIGTLVADTPDGEKRRRLVEQAVADNANDYGQLNVEVGYHYWAGAFVPDGSPVPAHASSPITYLPTTRPGHHLPHAWLDSPQGWVSTHDLVEPERLTLLVAETAADAWRSAAAGLDDVRVVPVPDPDGEWAEVREVGETGAVLVRPDHVVCWRAAALLADAGESLRSAVGVVLAGGAAPPDDPAAPYLERIHAAAAGLTRRPREGAERP